MRAHHRSLQWAFLQGLYDLFGGLWPLLHMRSFAAVTGPKSDEWLVRAVAGILVVVGAGLLHDVRRGYVPITMARTAMGVSLVLALVALISSLAGWISWVYFLDGIAHATLFLGWCYLLWHRWRQRDRKSPAAM